MSLFMNRVEHPEMFMNSEEIPTTNQQYYKYDSFAELMESQKKVNHSLQHSFNQLQSMYSHQEQTQMNRWDEITNQITHINETNYERSKFENKMMRQIHELLDHREQIEHMLAHEVNLKEEFIHQMNRMIKDHEQTIEAELQQYGTSTEKLSDQIQELHHLQQKTSTQVNDQQKEQINVRERIENQEALMEKTLRQLTNFRSVLYERTNDLAGKIEESYEMTSAYFYQLLTGAAEPFHTFVTKHKQQDKLNTK